MRGGARGKASGGFKKESDTRINLPETNGSIFHSLQDGCFEKDFMAYCANRLTDFSCVHWLPKDSVPGPPIYYAKGNQTLPAPAPPLASYNVSKPDRLDCYIHYHIHRFMFLQIAQVIVPMFVTLGLIFNLFIFFGMRRLGHTYLPLCLYISYLALFDTCDIVLRGGDMIVEYIMRLRLIPAVQLLRGSSCQMFPMAFNIFKHVQATLYIGLAVDSWRFVREPMRLFNVYKKEWIRNVVILSAALYITLNCQFFWTFDLINQENQIIHGRNIRDSWKCGFSSTLNQYYVTYIWPLIDLLAGEILPFCFAALFGSLSAVYIKNHKPDMQKLSRYLINTEFVLGVNRTFTRLVLVYAIFTLPRVLYFLSKFCYYGYIAFNKKDKLNSASMKSGYNGRNRDEQKSSIWASNERRRQFESWMELMEFSVKLLELMLVSAKFAVLLVGLPQFRSRCAYYLSWSCFRKRPTGPDTVALNQKMEVASL